MEQGDDVVVAQEAASRRRGLFEVAFENIGRIDSLSVGVDIALDACSNVSSGGLTFLTGLRVTL